MARKVLYLLIYAACIWKSGSSFDTLYGMLAGKYQMLSECVNGGLRSTSTLDITTTEMIRKEGYPVEEHLILTDDGYYLTMHRIPGGTIAQPIFVQHGILSSSFDWVVSGKAKALAFVLADSGYDVWLGNCRGNTYSRCHTKYNTSQSEFWNFSFHEMGIYDLPAEMSYIWRKTSKKIIYVGYSMGTTMSYVMAIERPDITAKLKALVSLAPVAYLTLSDSPLKLMTGLMPFIEFYTRLFGEFEFPGQRDALIEMSRSSCFDTTLQRKLCMDFVFAIVGFDAAQFNYTLVPSIMSHAPAGSSAKTFAHFNQLIRSQRFQYYDYGSEENFRRYCTSSPPEYDLSELKLPVALFWSENDLLATPVNVERLSERLPNEILNYKIQLSDFNHLDFVYAIDAFKYVYSKLLSVLQDFE